MATLLSKISLHDQARAAVALLVTLSLASAGCTSVHDIATMELLKLNGFREPQGSLLSKLDPRAKPAPVYRVTDKEGKVHDFDESSRLVLMIRTNGKESENEARYRAVDVTPEQFLGMERESGREVRVPMTQIDHAGLREFSTAKTLGLVGGILGAALVGAIIIVAVSPSGGGSGGSSGWDWD